MTNEQSIAMVVKNQAGDYFIIPQELLQGIRVPEEQKAQIEQLIAEQQDAQGYIWHALLTPLAVIITGGVLIGREIYNQGQVEAVVPNVVFGGSPEQTR